MKLLTPFLFFTLSLFNSYSPIIKLVINDIEVITDTLPPALIIDAWKDTICQNSGNFFSVFENSLTDSILWEVSNSSVKINRGNIQYDRDAIIETELLGSFELCVQGANACGRGPQVCRTIKVMPEAEANFEIEPTFYGDTTSLQFKGVIPPGAIYSWDFGNAKIINGADLGPFEITFDTIGLYKFQLNIGGSFCTDTITKFFYVNNQTEIGQLTACSPTISGITGGNLPAGCFVCRLDYEGSTDGFMPEVPYSEGFSCGTIENNQFFTILSGTDGTFTANITAENCVNGSGVQIVLFDQNLQEVSTCFSSGGMQDIPGFITAVDLIPNEVYFLMVDGFAGDICDFTIFMNGHERLQPPENPVVFSEADTFRHTVGDTVCYYIDTLIYAFTYDWNFPVSGEIIVDQKYRKCIVYDSFGGGAVVVRSKNPCWLQEGGGSFPVLVYPDSTTSTGGFYEGLDFEVFPNPSTGKIKIQTLELVEKVEVIGYNGKVLIKSSGRSDLDISDFPNGVYFLKIFSNGKHIVKRIILVQ